MKFGLHLQHHIFPPWRNEYIQYDHMKYFLKGQQLTRGWTEQDEAYFVENFVVAELNKVSGLIPLKIKQIRSIMHQESEQEISKKANDLIAYIKLNATGFQKILKKHDKWTGIPLQHSIRFRDINQQFEASIYQLNQTIYSYRIDNNDSLRNTHKKQEKIKTTKYWIHPDNLTEVQAILLFNLPRVQQHNSWNSAVPGKTMINSIYFDNPTRFNLYSGLLERNEAAETIRARWHGLVSNVSNVYIERKTHYESWLRNKDLYVKERICLPFSEVSDYISKGTYGGQQNVELAASIYETMHKNELKSTLRCYHHRTSYQGDHSLRVTLDTNMAFMKEMNPSTWRRNDIGDSYPFDHLHPHEIYLFPYAVLETKMLFGNDSTPEWFESLVEGQLVYEVPYFSKYLHGASHFFRRDLPMLPWWLGEMDVDIRRRTSYPVIGSQPSADFSQQQQQQQQQRRCVIIEPPLLPDYVGITPSEQKDFAYKEDQDDKKLYNNTSSCTVINSSHISLANNGYAIESGAFKNTGMNDAKPSAYDSFLSSNIVTKMKNMKEAYCEETIRDENYVSMPSWMYAKITNDKTLLLSSQHQILTIGNQQIMPKKGKLKKKVEPKIFFANERTFISWLQFSGLLLAVSLGLINFGDQISKASGGLFILIAVVLAVYAQLRFQYRAWQIRFRSESRFDDLYGPAALCLVLVIALIVNLGLRINQPLPVTPSPFSYSVTSDDWDDINNTTQQIITNHRFENGTKINKHGRVVGQKENEEDEA